MTQHFAVTNNNVSQNILNILETTTVKLAMSTINNVLNHTSNLTNFKHVSYFRPYFAWYDYILFSVMLMVSAAIGLYYGCHGNRNKTTEVYLMGGKRMGVWPLTISLIAGHTSGLVFLGLPADIYTFGATFALSLITYTLAGLVIAYVFMPVFFKLKISSTYEYLEKRFDRRCRSYASTVFSVYVLLLMSVVVYSPALAFQTVTGINAGYTIFVLCAICIFYTTLGGFRAVVWTDAVQFLITITSLITLLILGVYGSGGLQNVLKVAKEKGRLDISFKLDLTERETFWAIIVGLTIHQIGLFGFNHTCVQKWLAAKTYKDSVKTVLGYTVGMGLRDVLIVMISLAMFARYSDCDPVASKQVNKKDQLMPFFVTDISKTVPGLSGLYVAGLFCGELSTLSSSINALISTVYEDFLKIRLNRKNNPKHIQTILKFTGVVIGVATFSLTFLVQNLGGIFSLANTFMTVAYGPLLALFTLGIMCPTANSKGAFWGSILALIVVVFMAAGNKYYTYIGMEIDAGKPTSVDNCPFEVNSSSAEGFNSSATKLESIQPIILFRIAFYWYSTITTFTGIVSGLIISYFTGGNDPPVDKELLNPLVYRWYMKICRASNDYSKEDSPMIQTNAETYRMTEKKCKQIESNED